MAEAGSIVVKVDTTAVEKSIADALAKITRLVGMESAVERAIFELDRIPEYAYTGHTPTCQGEPGCPLCRALAILRGHPKDDDEEVLDNDLPGMWEKADFLGGAPDVVRGPDYTPTV